MVKVDFTGVSAGFEPVAAGPYPAVITKLEIKDSQSTPGAQYVSAEFTLSDDAGEAAGRKVFTNWSLLHQALWRFKQDAVALGIDPNDLDSTVDIDAVLDDLKGREAILELGIEKYNKKDGTPSERNVVNGITELTVGSR